VDLTAERIFEVLSACGMAHALPLSFAAVFNVRRLSLACAALPAGHWPHRCSCPDPPALPSYASRRLRKLQS